MQCIVPCPTDICGFLPRPSTSNTIYSSIHYINLYCYKVSIDEHGWARRRIRKYWHFCWQSRVVPVLLWCLWTSLLLYSKVANMYRLRMYVDLNISNYVSTWFHLGRLQYTPSVKSDRNLERKFLSFCLDFETRHNLGLANLWVKCTKFKNKL